MGALKHIRSRQTVHITRSKSGGAPAAWSRDLCWGGPTLSVSVCRQKVDVADALPVWITTVSVDVIGEKLRPVM